MSRPVKLVIGALLLGLAGLLAVVVFGTIPPPAPMESLSAAYRAVDFGDVPPARTLAVKHGSPVAYRVYGTGAKGAAIAIHGAGGPGLGLHPLAKALAGAGYAVYVPDLRGHGATGTRGDVDFLRQPDMDLMALILKVREEQPGKPLTLLGFSLGGGFLINFVGAYANLQPDRLVLLAPALGPGAPTLREGDFSRWVLVHTPRFVGLTILNYLGFSALNGLETLRFAPGTGPDQFLLTPAYSYRLHASLLPLRYKTSLEKITIPIHVLSGERDELFAPAPMREAFAGLKPNVDITIVPGADHIGLTLNAAAHAVIIERLETRP